MKKSKIFTSIGLIMLITLIGKFVGFIKEAIIVAKFGATYQSDAYNISLIIPYIAFSLIGISITTTFIPILSDINEKKGEKKMFEFASDIINLFTLISIIIFIMGWYFSSDVVKMIAPTYEGRAFQLTVKLVRISMLNLVFLSCNSAFMAVLQVKEEFFSPALTGLMISIPILIFFLFGMPFGIEGLSYVTTFGFLLQILIQIPWMKKIHYSHRFYIDFTNENLKKMFILIVPVIVGEGVNQINVIVDRMMASSFSEGSIAALNLSAKTNNLIYTIFSTAIVTVIFPLLSKEAVSEKNDGFHYYLNRSINNMLLILIPATVFVMIFNNNIVCVLFKHGIFDDKGVYITSSTLFYYSLGLVFYGIRDICNKAFYSLKDTKTPMRNGIVGVALNIVLILILVKYFGIIGLPLAYSISAACIAILLYINLQKKISRKLDIKLFCNITKYIFASIAMGGVDFCVYNYLIKYFHGISGEILLLIICFIVSLSVYLLLLILLKEREVINTISVLRRKLSK